MNRKGEVQISGKVESGLVGYCRLHSFITILDIKTRLKWVELTKSQAVTGKLPLAAVVLQEIVLLLQWTLIRVDDDGRTHLILSRLLRGSTKFS